MVRTFVLPVLAAAAFGWALARSIHSLTTVDLAPQLLTAPVYGPLRELGDLARPPLVGVYFAVQLALVLGAGRDYRWRPLATVLVCVGFVGVAVAMDLRWQASTGLTLKSLGPAFGQAYIHLFAWNSPEGFLFIILGALGWHLLLVGCLTAAWVRHESVPADGSLGPSSRLEFLISFLRDVAPVPLAWAAFGYSAGACIDATAVIRTDYQTPLTGGPTTLRLLAGPPASFMGPARCVLPAYFGGLGHLLWHACNGLWARRRAAVWYAVAACAQFVVAACWIADEGFQRFVSLEGPGLRQMLEEIPVRLALLVFGATAWHPFAIWCLFRYRSGRWETEPPIGPADASARSADASTISGR